MFEFFLRQFPHHIAPFVPAAPPSSSTGHRTSTSVKSEHFRNNRAMRSKNQRGQFPTPVRPEKCSVNVPSGEFPGKTFPEH
jgi:hypothetical protein